MSDQRIPISQLSETQTAPDASYIAIDDGSLTKKITVENFNSTSTASAQQYANQAAASAQTVEDNIATSAAQIREATLAAREATQASTAATASATSAYDSASLAQNYSANASTSAGQAMNAADSSAQNVTTSKGYAEDSEAWAVGKRNGADVPASDETYQNNAKYYANSASGSATRAEAAAQSITAPDTTLTVSGVAADSKVVGDRLSEAIPTDTYEDVNTTFAKNTFWNSEGAVASVASYTGFYQASAPIEVAENEVYFVGAKAGSSSKQRVICIVDENYNILHRQGYGSNVYYSAIITVPQNGKYLLITTVAEDTASVIIRKYSTTKYEASNTEKFKGLSFSVMGDSFSSYTGEIPSSNRPYYTGNNAGVYSPNEMWYSVVGRILGMTADTINGYSGSLVTSGVRNDITPASDASRCSNLGTNPDIIIIAMGVNDYSYSAPLGDWDGTTNHADDTTTYRTAYATMLKRIKSNYPNALIVCITPFFTQRGINNGTTYVNGIPLTCYDYVKATRDIAEIMGCCVIDGWNIGFNRHNYYPQYCSDSNTTPTHPNARGHRVIGETIAKELSVVAEGFINNINANNI